MIKSIDYFNYGLTLTDEEIKIQKKILDWIPNEIIDCHVHCGQEEDILNIEERTYKHVMSTFLSNSIEQSELIHQVLLPEKIVHNLKFPFVFKGINHKNSNTYLLEKSSNIDNIALYGIPDEIDYTIKMLNQGNFSALKMYPAYFNPNATKIYEYFPREILKVVQETGIPIILHLPCSLIKCIDQVITLLEDFPYLKVVICHMGLSKIISDDLIKVYLDLKKYKNVFFDNAMIQSEEVFFNAINIFGSERILFGSDEPLHLIRANVYINPILGERYISEYPYHWLDKNEVCKYKNFSKVKVSMFWQILDSMYFAISKFPDKEQTIIKNNIFFNNSKSLFNF